MTREDWAEAAVVLPVGVRKALMRVVSDRVADQNAAGTAHHPSRYQLPDINECAREEASLRKAVLNALIECPTSARLGYVRSS